MHINTYSCTSQGGKANILKFYLLNFIITRTMTKYFPYFMNLVEYALHTHGNT